MLITALQAQAIVGADNIEAPPRPTLAEVVCATIADALQRHGGNVSSAARELGIDRRTIYRYQRGGNKSRQTRIGLMGSKRQ